MRALEGSLLLRGPGRGHLRDDARAYDDATPEIFGGPTDADLAVWRQLAICGDSRPELLLWAYALPIGDGRCALVECTREPGVEGYPLPHAHRFATEHKVYTGPLCRGLDGGRCDP